MRQSTVKTLGAKPGGWIRACWKIRFALIATGEEYMEPLNRIERKREAMRACNSRPILQDTCAGKFHLYLPRTPEDCNIAPCHGARTRAFEETLKRQYGEELKKE